ncbi:MAG: hypothetical protein E7605_00670 [Ruminococcaceae bacterium]|nr:hypothetical protein [Oscillospiraceae bacterium]
MRSGKSQDSTPAASGNHSATSPSSGKDDGGVRSDLNARLAAKRQGGTTDSGNGSADSTDTPPSSGTDDSSLRSNLQALIAKKKE